MTFTRADMLAIAERSPAAAGARDRNAWVGLFMSTGRIEDPVGSQPHHGRASIGRFFDTFIGPREIAYHRDVDIVVGPTVIRDGVLEAKMAPAFTMRVPVYLRYDLQDDAGELKIAALSAFWELQTMVGEFLRGGLRAVPAGVRLSRLLLSNQGLTGTFGFLRGFRRIGGGKELFARFLDDACGGDEVGMRRRLAGDVRISSGDDLPLSASELRNHLSGATWRKLIGAGHAVVAATERAGQRSVVFADISSGPAAITTIRVFSEGA
jgi:Nuclear transport factor 2 (NTF2) domain